MKRTGPFPSKFLSSTCSSLRRAVLPAEEEEMSVQTDESDVGKDGKEKSSVTNAQ